MKNNALLIMFLLACPCFALENGGSGGSLGPCMNYSVGQLMASYQELWGQTWVNVKVYYTGNCEARIEKKKLDGSWYQQPFWVTAACDCGALPNNDVVYALDLGNSAGGGVITVTSAEESYGFDVINLDSGITYISDKVARREGSTLVIPNASLNRGNTYLVVAYNREGIAHGFTAFQYHPWKLNALPYFAMWQDGRTLEPIRSFMVYLPDNRLWVFNQRADGSLNISSGFTTETR